LQAIHVQGVPAKKKGKAWNKDPKPPAGFKTIEDSVNNEP